MILKIVISTLFGLSALTTSQIVNAYYYYNGDYYYDEVCDGGEGCPPPVEGDPGESASNPIIGTPLPGGSGGWSFLAAGTGNDGTLSGPIYFDPAVAVGYFYDSDVAFSGVTVGFAYGDDLYDLSVWDGSGALNDVASYTPHLQNWNGDLYNFNSNNISKILISGIETNAAIDPANPTGFVTGFTFDAALGAPINLTQIPVVTSVPLPQAWLLLGLGLLGMRAIRFGSSKAYNQG